MMISLNASSQDNNTAYFMNRLPQSAMMNPAYHPSFAFHLGLPALSSLNSGIKTNFVSYNDVILKSPYNDSLITWLHPDADINIFFNKLGNSNIINSNLNLGIFSAGFRISKFYFNFSINEHFMLRGVLPKDLFFFVLKGNEDFKGKKMDFSKTGFDLSLYREYSLGLSEKISDKWVLGARAKLLFGKGNISLVNPKMSLYTDPADFSMQLHCNFVVNSSLPIRLEYNGNDEINDIIFLFDESDFNIRDWVLNTNNMGFALDLGASYQVIDEVTVSASIINLGFIHWKQDVYNFSMDGELNFEGLDISSLLIGNGDDTFEQLLDSITDIFAITDTRHSYRKHLNPGLFLGGFYTVIPKLRLGALSRTYFYNENIEQALTISANTDLNRWFSATLSYSLMSNSYNNIGLGIALRGGPFQFYLISDNASAFLLPHQARIANLWFGMNILIGREKKQKPIEVPE